MNKTRGFLIGVVAVLVVAMTVSPVLAKPVHGKRHAYGRLDAHGRRHAYGKNKFQLEGVVKSISISTDTAVPSTLTVTVTAGSQTIKQFRTLDLTMSVASDAKIVQNAGGGSGPITLDKVAVGSKVHVGGTINGTVRATPVYWAKKIIVQKVPAPTP